jgi:predicted RNA-binding Zn-ribbon protein involved in translation (DUF1610 family)
MSNKQDKYRDTRKSVPWIPYPDCPSCNDNVKVRSLGKNFFRCLACASVFQNTDYERKQLELRKCPICGNYVEIDNWQIWYESGHFSFGGKTQKRNFCLHCYPPYYTRIMSEHDAVHKDITDGEIVSQLDCPKCGRKEIYFYDDDDPNRASYMLRIYQCMFCDYVIPNQQMETVLIEAKRRRLNGDTTSPTVVSKLS